MYNPYDVLGVSKNWPLEDIEKEYLRQKKELRNIILTEGEVGAQAADKLERIKEAYLDIENSRISNPVDNETSKSRPYGRIEDLVKEGNLIEAQKLLDVQTERGAEWHYIQAALYYKQGWIMESKTQLELAKKLDPYEEKYNKAYVNLMNVLQFGNPDGKDGNNQQSNRSYPQYENSTVGRDATCCNICGALLLADCCCDCLSGC